MPMDRTSKVVMVYRGSAGIVDEAWPHDMPLPRAEDRVKLIGGIFVVVDVMHHLHAHGAHSNQTRIMLEKYKRNG